MEPRSETSGMELLESDPPGAVERFTTALARHRGVRLAGLVAAALLVGAGFATGFFDGEPPRAAPVVPQEEPAPVDRDRRYVPPPWVTSARVGWVVLGRPSVSLEGAGYVVVIRAVNLSSGARKPQGLRAVGRFVGRPGFRFTATCHGFDNDATGTLRPLRTAAEPAEEILLRCTDVTEYPGARPDLVVRSLKVQGTA